MKKVELSNTGVEVSCMCLGAMRFGTDLNDEASSFRLMDMFVEAGGNFIDTANCYSTWYPGGEGGDSEPVIGKWLAEQKNRKEMFIATKVGVNYQDVPRGLGADLIVQECEKSLKRLGIETIDLYYAHSDDPNTPLEETMQAFDRLIKAGKVRFIGASNYLAWRLADAESVCKMNGWTPYSCVQLRFSYLRPKTGSDFGNQKIANTNMLEFCSDRGMTLLPYSPLLGGSYVREDKPIPESYVGLDTDARMKALQEVANEVGATLHQVVFAWMMHHSEPKILPVFSARNEAQMRENLGALEVMLSEEQMTKLNEAGV